MAIFSILFQVAVGVYMLYGAITGKNKLFELRFPKEGKKELYRKWTRIIFAAAGVLLLLMAGITILGNVLPEGHPAVSPLGVVLLVLSFTALTALLVLLALRLIWTDRKAQASRVGRGTAPRAAFFFDEEEK